MFNFKAVKVGLAPESWRCNGKTHVLRCEHAVTLGTRACSPSCLGPQLGARAPFSHKCPTCITIADEDHLLQESSNLCELRLTAEATQADHDHRAQSEELELIEEYISEREMQLEHEVSEDVWTLYMHEGEDGVSRRNHERKVEEERSRVEAGIPEWQRSNAADTERERGWIEHALEADVPFPIDHRIEEAEFSIEHYHADRATHEFELREWHRVAREHQRELVEVYRSYIPALQAAAHRRQERRRAAAQPQNKIEGTTEQSETDEWFQSNRVTSPVATGGAHGEPENQNGKEYTELG